MASRSTEASARSPDMWQPKKGFRSDFSRFKNQPKLSAQGLEPGCLLESFLACPWVLQRVVYVQVQFLPDEGGQLLVQVWVFWKYSQTGWQPKWQYCELPKGAVVTEQLLSAGSTLYESKRLSGLGRLTTVEGPWRWPRCLHSEARAMHEDIEGGQIVWSASTPCCLANKEQSAVKARESEVGSIAPLFRSLALTGSEMTTLGTPWGMWSLVPEVSVAAASQRDLVPPLYDAHDPKVCTYLGPSPREFLIASRLFSRWLDRSRTLNGGTSGAFMHAGVRTSGTFRPLFAPRPFTLWADCPEKWPEFNPTSARGLRALFWSLGRNQSG